MSNNNEIIVSKEAFDTYNFLLRKTYLYLSIRHCFTINNKNYSFERDYINHDDKSIRGEFYSLDKKYNVTKVSNFIINKNGDIEEPKELLLFYKKMIKKNK